MFMRNVMPVWAPDGVGAGTPDAGAPGGAPTAPVIASFADTLPEDIRAEAAFRDIKDLPGLAKSYFNATKMIGGRPEDMLRVPGPDDADAWKGIYGKLGRPDAVDGYKLTTAPEGVTIDEGLRSSYLETALEAGLSTRQADALFGWWNAKMGGMAQASETAVAQNQERAVGELKTEWGAAFDQNLYLAKTAIAHFGGEKLAQTLATVRTSDGIPLGDLPALAKLFAPIGKTLAEDGLIGRNGGGGDGGALAPTEARQQIASLQQDKQFAETYTNARAPGHAEAVAKMTRLYEFANPPRT